MQGRRYGTLFSNFEIRVYLLPSCGIIFMHIMQFVYGGISMNENFKYTQNQQNQQNQQNNQKQQKQRKQQNQQNNQQNQQAQNNR